MIVDPHSKLDSDELELLCNCYGQSMKNELNEDITDGNSHLWHQKYSLPSTKVLDFVACRVTSKILGIGSAERSWGDVKTIKSGKRSAHGSDISDKHSIVYRSACIEEAIIGRSISDTDTNTGSHSHSCNDDDQEFDYQLYQWGVEKSFHNQDEAITRELKMYIEEWGKMHIKNKSQVSKTTFLAKYGSLDPYDEAMEKYLS